jgi:toxin ParE1/3/4
MTLQWTEEAAADLEAIAEYLFGETPLHAARIVRSVYEAPSKLLLSPERGRPGKRQGTRELVLTPLPYLVVYTVSNDVIDVVRVLHGAQKWP